MMEALRSSETSVLTRAARRNVPEDGVIHCKAKLHICEALRHEGSRNVVTNPQHLQGVSCRKNVICRQLHIKQIKGDYRVGN
jgi:hypothetical protein